MPRIPVARPDLGGNEERYAVEAIRSSWISGAGPFIDRFEAEFASLCDTEHAIACCNGTVALHLALLALAVRPGDEVLVPSMTYVATANALRYVGAEPVFVDIDSATWCLDPNRIEDAITPRTRGIIAVHLYGHPADMDAISHLAGVHGLWVIEDAAESHTARYRGRVTGGLGQVATFSFYGNKIFTAGEGGALTCNDSQLAKRIRTLRGQGVDPNRRYFFPVVGYNYRLSNVACAILCGQLERRDAILAERRRVYDAYDARLCEAPAVTLQPSAEWAEPAPWLYTIALRDQPSRDAVAAALAEREIETRPAFVPLHTLPAFRESAHAQKAHLPVTELLGACGLNLPTFSGLGQSDIDEICGVICEVTG